METKAMVQRPLEHVVSPDIHTCSYYCDRPECMKRQRDELRDWMEKLNWLSGEIVDAETLRLHMGEMSASEVRVAQAAYRFGRMSGLLGKG